MNIIAYSPTYLRFLKEESLGYKFKFQGYGNLDKASKGLLKVNASEVYGFCVVLDELPENTSALSKFLRACDIMSLGSRTRKRFVFSLQDSSGLYQYLKKGGYKNLDFYSADFSILTDLFIKQEIFGSILEGYLNPYTEKISGRAKPNFSLNSLKAVPVFPASTMKVVEPIKFKSTSRETEIEDLHLEGLERIGRLFYLLRLYAIRSYYEEEKDLEEEIEGLIKLSPPNIKLSHELLYKYVKDVWRNSNGNSVAR